MTSLRAVFLLGLLMFLAACNSKSSSSTEYSPVEPTNNPPTAGRSSIYTNTDTNSVPPKIP